MPNSNYKLRTTLEPLQLFLPTTASHQPARPPPSHLPADQLPRAPTLPSLLFHHLLLRPHVTCRCPSAPRRSSRRCTSGSTRCPSPAPKSRYPAILQTEVRVGATSRLEGGRWRGGGAAGHEEGGGCELVRKRGAGFLAGRKKGGVRARVFFFFRFPLSRRRPAWFTEAAAPPILDIIYYQ